MPQYLYYFFELYLFLGPQIDHSRPRPHPHRTCALEGDIDDDLDDDTDEDDFDDDDDEDHDDDEEDDDVETWQVSHTALFR